MSLSSSESLLNEVAFSIGALRQAKSRFAERLAPEFNFFDYLRSDEMGLSNCIAGLLDPKGPHGQGSVFLRAFFTNIVGKENWIDDFENCEITTEKQANGQRRIDIFLRFGDAVVGIENKPWAGDQNEQLADYATYLRKVYGKKWLLVYLCDRDPSRESLPPHLRECYESQGNFVQCSFVQVIRWLEECSIKTRALQVRIFIEELCKFVRLRIKGELEMSEEKETMGVILQSARSLEAAFDVFKAIGGTKQQIFEKFRQDLLTTLKVDGFDLVWDDTLTSGGRSSAGFGIVFNHNQDVYLRFEFEYAGLNGFFWGLRRKDKTVVHEPERWGTLSERMTIQFGSGGTSEWWSWYRVGTKDVLGLDVKDWYQDAKPWSLLINGLDDGQSVASRFSGLARTVLAALGKDVLMLSPKT